MEQVSHYCYPTRSRDEATGASADDSKALTGELRQLQLEALQEQQELRQLQLEALQEQQERAVEADDEGKSSQLKALMDKVMLLQNKVLEASQQKRACASSEDYIGAQQAKLEQDKIDRDVETIFMQEGLGAAEKDTWGSNLGDTLGRRPGSESPRQRTASEVGKPLSPSQRVLKDRRDRSLSSHDLAANALDSIAISEVDENPEVEGSSVSSLPIDFEEVEGSSLPSLPADFDEF